MGAAETAERWARVASCAGECEPGEGPAGARWTASWCGGDPGRTSSGAGGEGHPGGLQRAKVLDPRGTSPAPGACDDVGQQGWTHDSMGVAQGPCGGKQQGRWGLVGPLAEAVGGRAGGGGQGPGAEQRGPGQGTGLAHTGDWGAGRRQERSAKDSARLPPALREDRLLWAGLSTGTAERRDH